MGGRKCIQVGDKAWLFFSDEHGENRIVGQVKKNYMFGIGFK